LPPNKGDFQKLVRFYDKELPDLGVEVRLGTEATQELLESLSADVFVIAAGSIPSRPPIPGADLPHVAMAQEVLGGKFRIDAGPVVVIGGGASGLETADFISGKGLQVTVIEMLAKAGRDILDGIGVREALLTRLAAQGVSILTSHRAVAIEEDAVIVSERPLIGEGEKKQIPASFVVISLGNRPVDVSLPQMERKAEWHRVGDCCNPGNAYDAIHQAYEVALGI
jgi:NADPH-dependent 2,4-dienoyl-CoA reductase/sulfur reductase-like enzyme